MGREEQQNHSLRASSSQLSCAAPQHRPGAPASTPAGGKRARIFTSLPPARGWKQAPRERPNPLPCCVRAPALQSARLPPPACSQTPSPPCARQAPSALPTRDNPPSGLEQAAGTGAAPRTPPSPQRAQAASPPPDLTPASGTSPKQEGAENGSVAGARRRTRTLPPQLCHSHTRGGMSGEGAGVGFVAALLPPALLCIRGKPAIN